VRVSVTSKQSNDRRSGSRIMASGLRIAAVAALSFLLSGCLFAAAPVRKVSLPQPPKQTQAPRDHQRILAAHGGAYHDPRLEAFVARIVARLAAASDRPGLRYKVTVLNSPTVNAFALPSGQLYVTRGLIALANDTSELASVLAHEMAHVIARHAAIREDQAYQAAAVLNRAKSEVLADPYLGALALAKSKIALATFSRAQEFEADSIGIRIAARAGFDPNGAARFLASLDRNAHLKPNDRYDPHLLDFISHPATPERISNAQDTARQHSVAGGGERDREAYLAGVEGLLFGDDPNQGFVRGRRFLHPKFGFTFTAPDGFVLENTAHAVLGMKDGGGQTLRLDVVRVPTDQPLSGYVSSGWIENVDPASVEEVTVNGFPAITATARGDQWSFRLYVVRFGVEVYRVIFAAKHMTPEVDKTFRESFNTFRHLRLAEIEAAKPLRLAVVTTTPGDSLEQLASRMAVPDRPLEHFRVLNGLAPGQSVEPGNRMKIVVE
jgi:predicted Zn-dependent protease